MWTRFTCLSETTPKGIFDSRLESEVREEVLGFGGIDVHGAGPTYISERSQFWEWILACAVSGP